MSYTIIPKQPETSGDATPRGTGDKSEVCHHQSPIYSKLIYDLALYKATDGSEVSGSMGEGN